MKVATWYTTFITDTLHVRMTRAQRVVARVVFDGIEPKDLSADDRAIASKLFGDVDTIPPEARAVFVGIFGARSGKSYLFAALYCLWRALTADLSTLAPGEFAVALIVCPDLRLAKQTLRYASGAANTCPSIKALIESDTADALVIRRPDGKAVSIEALPATRGGSALRGRSLVCAILDEAAFMYDDQYVANAEALFKAVAPRILPGGIIIVATTPWAEAGLAYDEFVRNFGHPITAIAAQAPTELMRDDSPTILAMVARERLRDPDNALREFDAQFIGIGTGFFFDYQAVRDCVRDDLYAITMANRALVGVGGDLALVRDAAALVVTHLRSEVYNVAEIKELRPSKGNPLKLSAVVKEFSTIAANHGAHTITVDHHVLQPAREHLTGNMQLVPIHGGNEAKYNSYVTARNLINMGLVRIPGQYRALAAQLCQVVSRPISGGGIRIDSPRRAGSHGDIASAFILALHAAHRCGSGANASWYVGYAGHRDTSGIAERGQMFKRGGNAEPDQSYESYYQEQLRKLCNDELPRQR